GMVSKSSLAFAAGCSHIMVEPDACTNRAGIKCGFKNTFDCTRLAECSLCNVQDDGCPEGTSPSTEMWRACCACVEGEGEYNEGDYIEYWDCCGSMAAECYGCLDAMSCRGGFECSGSWCGPTPGDPECTCIYNTGRSCLVP